MTGPILDPITVTGQRLTPLEAALAQQTSSEFKRLEAKPRANADFQRLLQKDFVPKGSTLETVVVNARRARPLLRTVGSRALGWAGLFLTAKDIGDFLYERYGRKTGTQRRYRDEPLVRPHRGGGYHGGRKPPTYGGLETGAVLDPIEVSEVREKPARKPRGPREPLVGTRRTLAPKKARPAGGRKLTNERTKARQEATRLRQREATARTNERIAALKEKQRARDDARREREKKRKEEKSNKKLQKTLTKGASKFAKQKFGKKAAPLTRTQPSAQESTNSQRQRCCAPKPKKQDQCGCPNPNYKLEMEQWQKENCGSSTK